MNFADLSLQSFDPKIGIFLSPTHPLQGFTRITASQSDRLGTDWPGLARPGLASARHGLARPGPARTRTSSTSQDSRTQIVDAQCPHTHLKARGSLTAHCWSDHLITTLRSARPCPRLGRPQDRLCGKVLTRMTHDALGLTSRTSHY